MENWSILRIIMVALLIVACIFLLIWFDTIGGLAVIAYPIMKGDYYAIR